MILHPGAHFGDFPHPIGSGESRVPPLEPRPIASRQSCTRSGCFQSRVHWPALTLRHRHPVASYAGTACVSRTTKLSRIPPPRRDSADSVQTGMRGGKTGETSATKRVLKFRRLHLVHSSAVAAQQTVVVTALILEFSLSLPRLHPLPFPFSFSCFLSFTIFPRAFGEPADFLRKISDRRDIGFLCEVRSDFIHAYYQIFYYKIFLHPK